MSLPKEHTLYRLTKREGYEHIKAFREPVPTDLKDEEILVKINAVSLNYRDLTISTGLYPAKLKDNVVPVSDGAGVIVKAGSGVRDLEVGDRVILNFDSTHLYGPTPDKNESELGGSQDGVLTQYKRVHYQAANKLPKDSHLSDQQAATLVCTGVTAWNALYGSGDRFVAGQTVLILGTGGMAITSLVLARAAGAVTIITSSSDEKLKYVQEHYGADHGINYTKYPDWEKKVLELTDNQGVDFVIENGGNGTILKSLASVKPGGQVAIIGILDNDVVAPDIVLNILLKEVLVRGIKVGSKKLCEELLRFVHAKKLELPVNKVFGFTEDQVHAAYKYLESQTQIGKIVIAIDHS